MTKQDVHRLKAEGKYREAGAAAFASGEPIPHYGCHFGMRSTLELAKAEYTAGFDEAKREAEQKGTPARYTQLEAELRARAAEYAAALLVERPELCDDEGSALELAILRKSETEGECQLIEQIEAALQRDDEDTDETARLIFEALAK